MKKLLFACLVMLANAEVLAATSNYCGGLQNSYGPYDYRRRSEFAENFRLVEMAHFTPEVENGIKGTTGHVGGDLDYTLRAIPNHHRALASLSTFALRNNAVHVQGMRYPVECWFIRALQWTPDDGAIFVVYGSYLFSLGKTEKAVEMFRQGLALEPDNISLNYNLGLAYFKQKNYEQAREHAKKAYAGGFPLPGLKNKLIEANQWDQAGN